LEFSVVFPFTLEKIFLDHHASFKESKSVEYVMIPTYVPQLSLFMLGSWHLSMHKCCLVQLWATCRHVGCCK